MIGMEEIDIKNVSGYFEKLEEHKILFMFKGDFNQELINAVVVLVEGIPQMADENILVKSRVSGSIIECMQNVCRHGASLNVGAELRPGIILISKSEKEYYISIGNLVPTKKVKKLEEYMNKIKRHGQK